MFRRRPVLLGGGIVAVILIGSSMLAWANGAFGNPAVDRVGSFRTIETQLAAKDHAISTTTSRPSSAVVPSTSRPEERVEPTVRSTQPTTATSEVPRVATPEPTVAPNPAGNGTTISARRTDPTTLAPVASTSRARPPSDDDHEPSDGRGRDD